MIASLCIGGADFQTNGLELVFVSRLPRTLAVVLAGVSLAIAGVIMQQLARNRFVEPGTTGAAEWSTLGILLVLLFTPELSVLGKMIVACVFALIGTSLFMLLLKRLPARSDMLVPLAGIMYAGVIGAVITFIAYRVDLLQAIWVWMQGDFSMILRGRYELLWIAAGMSLVAYITADHLTLAGLGKQVSTNLGLNYSLVFAWGLIVVSLITGVTVVVAGAIPFVGLVVPNIVSQIRGDNLKNSMPWVALTGAGLVLCCDLLARLLRYPYEIPVGTVTGVIGSIIFLHLLLKPAPKVRGGAV
ncbi:ABC transporter permease [Corallincola luteus]|uniref:ABC transporter permease n=1 Tax=Corallincola luteus TaxID=1775177 RepID=A0ABY2AN42_9GAMM|nr:iron chelate uptake ABC transporter family permease subunit [Corallincola luteus]TCI03707.1 ABC transporter permease [Corallincola luteus]